MSTVQLEINNHIAFVTLNREQALNSFDYEMLCNLQNVVDEIHLNKNIQVVIFTGAGNKAFSAGADLKERKSLSESEVRRNVKAIREVFNKVASLPQPTIAAVNGYALGGGFEFILACDLAIAARSVTMGLTETSWAIIPGAGGTQRLPRLIGEMKAKELMFTARKISSEEAYELGIVLQVVEQDDLLDACHKLAQQILKNGPIAIQQVKYAINQGLNTDLQTGLEIEAKAYERTISTEDRLEALRAFSEKRTPQFKGR
ncbi:MAG TPA: enoyl-CoA hydratase-related protein [Bacillota bacterium]